METKVRCPLKSCEYNRFSGICIKKVITLHHIDLYKLSQRLRCEDYKEKN